MMERPSTVSDEGTTSFRKKRRALKMYSNVQFCSTWSVKFENDNNETTKRSATQKRDQQDGFIGVVVLLCPARSKAELGISFDYGHHLQWATLAGKEESKFSIIDCIIDG
jgi:hypothetical protein